MVHEEQSVFRFHWLRPWARFAMHVAGGARSFGRKSVEVESSVFSTFAGVAQPPVLAKAAPSSPGLIRNSDPSNRANTLRDGSDSSPGGGQGHAERGAKFYLGKCSHQSGVKVPSTSK